jgi:hypothetical protein
LSWHAIWVPKATPKSVIAKLNGAVVEALADPAVRRRLADVGQEMYPREQQTPEALSAYQSARSGNGGRSSGKPTSRRSDGLQALAATTTADADVCAQQSNAIVVADPNDMTGGGTAGGGK